MHDGILAGKQDGGCTKESIDSCTNVAGNSCHLAIKSNKPLTYRDNYPNKANLTFKRGFIVLKLAKFSAVNHLPLDSVLAVEIEPQTSNGTAGSGSRGF